MEDENKIDDAEAEVMKNFMRPLTIEDLEQTTLCHRTDKETLQLQADVINVFENRVDISSFPKERQQIIKNYYRFAPVSPATLSGSIAQNGVSRQGKG